MQKGLYKPTGNIAVDTVAACINSYALQGAKVAVITLSPIYWQMFIGFVTEKIPTFTISDNEVDFDGTIVRKAFLHQSDHIKWELEKKETKVYLMN